MRVGFAANNRNDYDVTLSLYHPEVVFETAVDIPDLDSVYRGHDGIRRMLSDWKSPFESFLFLPREIVDPGGERFAVLVEEVGEGRDSGLEVRQEQWMVYEVTDGLCTRQTIYWEESAALEALHSPP